MNDMTLFIAVQLQLAFAQLATASAHHERGQGMVEYGLILALIAAAVVVVLSGLGTSLMAKFNTISTCVAGSGSC